MTLLRVLCVLLILSGIGGVAAGEDSAVGGWWLIVVFAALLVLTFVGGRSRLSPTDDHRPQARRSQLIGAAVAVVAIAIVAPIVFVMLLGGG